VASLAQLTYSPENNFSGNDQWTWNGSDGKSYALLDVTVNMIITPVTGVDPLIPEGIQVYPNPVSGILHIEFPQHGLGKGNISFYDLSGRQVKNRTVDTDTMGSVDVDLSDLYGGFYILKIDHSGGQSQFRVVNH